jgi:hypothetical protein
MNVKRVYKEESHINIRVGTGANWSNILTSPEVDRKLSEQNDVGHGLVYLRNVNDQGEILPVSHPHLNYDEIKECLRRQKDKKEYMSFVTFDSIRDAEIVVRSSPYSCIRPLVYDAGGKRLFLGEPQTKSETSDCVINRECVSVEGIMNSKVYEFIFPVDGDVIESKELMEDLLDGRHAIISAMKVSYMTKRNVGGGKSIIVTEHCYFVNEYKAFDDPFHDVKKTIPKIISKADVVPFIDVGTHMPFYHEEINTILFFDICYVKYGDPVFNIVLSGMGGSAKTSYVQLLSKIYSRDGRFISSNMSTAKGLVPSYGDKPHPGLLIEPRNFVKVVDEFFRRAHKEALSHGMKDPTSHVYSFVNEAMNVVERRPDVLAGSGKGALPPDTFMKDSFLATDNLQVDIIRALCEMVRTDKAVARRFTFLQVTNTDADNVKNAQERPSPDEMYKRVDEIFKSTKGYGLYDLRRYGHWFRKASSNIRVDSKFCKEKAESILIEFVKGILTEGQTTLVDDSINVAAKQWSMELNVIPFYEAFVRCCAVLRCTIEHTEESLPTIYVKGVDYEDAEKYFRRLFRDTFDVYKEGVRDSFALESSVISKSFVGLNTYAKGISKGKKM